MLGSQTLSLRIVYLEDNPLIAFHVEQMIEDLGHVPVATLDSFVALRDLSEIEADCALIDIDLADGRTGPDAASWLAERGIPGIFVSGQRDLAEANADRVLACLIKPVALSELRDALERVPRIRSENEA
jgi:DNA-binding NtrC family response regulator